MESCTRTRGSQWTSNAPHSRCKPCGYCHALPVLKVRVVPITGQFSAACPQSEWENDRRGLPAMTSHVFVLAVFELIGTVSLLTAGQQSA